MYCMRVEGIWLTQVNECEYMEQSACENAGGTFNECGSACRHEEDAVVCTLECVPYCDFEDVDIAPDPVSDEEVREIASTQVPCTGEALQMCHLIRKEGATARTYFYDGIKGFARHE